MDNLLSKNLFNAASMDLTELTKLIEMAIKEIETVSKDIEVTSRQGLSSKIMQYDEIARQDKIKQLNQLTSLQRGYMFLDKAYELISGNSTEFTITSTVTSGRGHNKTYDFYSKTYSLKDVLSQTYTLKSGNYLLKDTIKTLKKEIQQESNKIKLEGNNLQTYKMFLSLTKNKNLGFNEGHVSEAMQRYLQDVKNNKIISKESIMKNIADSVQNVPFYKAGDLSRILFDDAGNLSHTIETQVKNLGKKTKILTVGNLSTVLNGLREFQQVLSSGAVGQELQQVLQEQVFSDPSNPMNESYINEALQQAATQAIDELFLGFAQQNNSS